MCQCIKQAFEICIRVAFALAWSKDDVQMHTALGSGNRGFEL